MGEPFGTSVAANLASKLVECLIAPIGRQFKYVLCFKSYVKDLENGVKDLGTVWERVQHAVEEAKNNGKPIENDIKNWLESVKETTEKADNLLKRGRSAENACLRGWLPNPVVRHPIGRKLKQITEAIGELLEESSNNKFQIVSYENRPIGVVTAATFPVRSADHQEDDLRSRASIKEKLLEALADDKVRVVGLWGAPGVGKSKLLDDIENRVKINRKPFDLVAMVKLSRNQDIRTIQEEIADALGLHQMNEKTPHGRACRIRERLERGPQKNILIIIDNLGEKLELKDVGIPCGHNNEVRGCKLLLSSRYRNILRDDMGCDLLSLFQLKVLERDEAQILFERTVGEKVNNLQFKAWVDGVVKNCGGLPLLIVPLAKKLKHKDLPAWRNASTNRDLSNVKSLVESSYRDLKDERIRLLFLICALSSGIISRRDSLLYCMGLDLLKKFSETIEKARDVLFEDLQTLQDSSLLLESHNMEWFRMHDVIVDVAISLHDKFMDMNWSALVWSKGYGYKEWPKDELRRCTAMSFSYVGIDELPEKLDCPNLRILLLFQHNQSLKISESFFDSTEKLQVLDIFGLSFTSLPSSIELLANLKSLSLDSCNLDDVTVLGKLIRLQFLSFQGSIIARLPKEIGELTELRFLDLRMCFGLKIIDPGVLKRLINLEDLYIGSFDQWEAEDESPRTNASLIELKKMKKLRTLYIYIPRWADLSSDLTFENLSEHKIQIGGIPDWRVGNKESNILKLKLDSGNLLYEVWMQRCLQLTHDLHLEGLEDVEDSVHKLCTKGFQQLKHLCVQNNSSFKYIVDSTQCSLFTELESLFLMNLNKLEKICHGVLASGSFSKIKIVKVENCGEIKHSFSSSMMRIFLQLEEIQISKCHSMQQIVADTEAEEDGDKIDDDPNLKSCKLRKLTLQNLPKMTSFSETMDHGFVFFNTSQVLLPWLESLTLSQLPKLKEIWSSQFPSDVSSLKFLNVEDCASLLSIFPSNLVIKLHNLEAMTIKRCHSIQEVFDLEGLIAIGDVEILSRLTTLTLSDLPRLGRMWNKNPERTSCFRNLRVLKVQNCKKLRFLFSSSMARALGQLKEIEVVNCQLMEEIIDVQEKESAEAATTDTLEFPLLTSLSLEELPNLKTFSYGIYCLQFPSLTRLRISGCPKMMTFSSFVEKQQLIIADTDLQQVLGEVNSSLSLLGFFNEKVLFPCLEKLKLSSMCQLKRIWNNQLHEQSFRKLASLTIEFCENLLHVFPSNSMDRLQSLNKIKVVGCPSLEALFERVCLSSVKRQTSLVLSALEKMKLLNLPRLRDILESDCKVTLAYPSLMEVNVRCCHSLPYLFSSATAKTLDKLTVLDVSCCNNLLSIIAMEEGKGKIIETLTFRQLSTLKLGDLDKLISFRLKSSARDGIYPLFEEKVLFPSLEELKLSSMCQLKRIWNNQLHEQSFRKLASLTIEFCENLLHVFPSNLMDRLQSLNKFKVVGCPYLEALFERVCLSSVKRQTSLVLSALEKMKLLNLPRLRDILESDCKVTLAYPSLMEVNVRCCHSLPYLFSSATVKTLDKLTVLDVSCCNNLLSIIAMEEGKGKIIDRLTFHQLSTLKLGDLDKLISFRLESSARDGIHPLFDEKLEFPKLEELHIERVRQEELWNNKIVMESFCHPKVLKLKQCNNLMNMIPSFMWQRLLHRVESLTIEKCPHLRNLFTMSMVKSLGQLQYLGLGGCDEMEYIIAKEEEKPEEAADPIVIPQLVTLHLHNMPKLMSFYQGKHISKWPSLKEFIIKDCKAMEVILGDANWRKLEGSIPMEQPLLLVKKVEFPSLESMKISHMDNLKKIWLDVLASNAFSKLKTLIVEHCPKLSSLFSSHAILTRFPNLEEIVVTDCGLLEVIFHNQEFNFGETCSISTFELRKLVLLRLPKMKHVWSGPPHGTLTFERLQCLKVERCESLKSLFPISIAKSMTQLEEVLIEDCGLEEIIMDEDGAEMKEGDLFFPQLTDLRLLELPELRSFYRHIHTSTWPLLKQLRVRHCGKMRSFLFACELQSCQGTTTCENQPALYSFEEVIPRLEGLTLTREDVEVAMTQQYGDLRDLSLACYHDENVAFPSEFLLQSFPSLEELVVICSSFEEIFPEDASGLGGATPRGGLTDVENPLKSLANLKRLDLIKLCNLRRVWKDGSLMIEILNLIKTLFVEECRSLSIVFPSPISFQRLKQLYVENCAGLVHMGTCSAMTSLVHLTWLTLRNCCAMEDVVTDDGNGAEEISFPELEELILDGLPSLESFSPTNCALRFPALERIVVTQCPKMNKFCKGALRTPNLDKVLLSDGDDEWRWDGDLDTTIRTLST